MSLRIGTRRETDKNMYTGHFYFAKNRTFLLCVDTFYRHLARGELAVFPKCGHNTYEQRPDDYVRAILDFITRRTGREESKVQPAMTCLA
jgi:hypothetical protein